MKIVLIDNFGRESIADTLVAENVSSYWGNRIVKLLNDSPNRHSDEHFNVVDNDYILWRGMEELV